MERTYYRSRGTIMRLKQYLNEAMPPQRIIEILRNNLKSYKKEEKISPNDEKVINDFLDWVLENQF